jgi:hypothetical protein
MSRHERRNRLNIYLYLREESIGASDVLLYHDLLSSLSKYWILYTGVLIIEMCNIREIEQM